MNQATQEFIRTHEKDDIFAISLAARSSDEIDYQLAIRQINGRQKIKLKVPTFYNCPHILYPVQLSLEQSSSNNRRPNPLHFTKLRTVKVKLSWILRVVSVSIAVLSPGISVGPCMWKETSNCAAWPVTTSKHWV